MESVKTVDNVCHDCGKDIEINGESIENGVYLSYDNEGSMVNVFKCNECYAKSPSLTNFQPCEVYSRVVGYIRPVQQWHKGKKQEYGERKEYNMPKEPCC
jgi:hypothetical protein